MGGICVLAAQGSQLRDHLLLHQADESWQAQSVGQLNQVQAFVGAHDVRHTVRVQVCQKPLKALPPSTRKVHLREWDLDQKELLGIFQQKGTV